MADTPTEKNEMNTLLKLMMACMLTGVCACSPTTSEPGAIASSPAFYVGIDSVAIHGHGIRPSRMLEQLTDTNPALISDIPTADWAFALEVLHHEPSSARSIWTDHAILHPEASARWLMAIDPDSDPYWGLAAWEVYCASGNRQWLAHAFETLSASLTRQIGRRNLTRTPLFCAPASTVQPLELNVLMAASARVAVEMARSLGRTPQPEAQLPRLAKELPMEINRALWWPTSSRYLSALCAYPYSQPVPTYSPQATALAVILGVATPEIGRMALTHTPAIPLGIPDSYPGTEPLPAAEPFTQLLWARAAALLNLEGHLDFAIGALLAPLAEKPAESLGAALALRVFAGMRLLPDGLAFTPCVPASCPGTKRIRGLHWRDAVIDITVAGTGSKIASITLDGRPADASHVAGITPGRHSIEITLANNLMTSSDARPEIVAQLPTLLPTPVPDWITPRTASVAEGTYRLWVNGVLEEVVKGTDISLPDIPTRLMQLSLFAVEGEQTSLPSKPHLVIPPGMATEFAVEGDTLALVASSGAGAMVAQLCYAPTEREGAVQVEVNDSLQTIIAAPPGRSDSLWSAPAPLILAKGTNRISFSQHTSSTNKILHLRLIPLP